MAEHYPSFPLQLITPESIYFAGEASMVEVPGTLGDFGVLKGHMPFISTIRPGVVRIHLDEATADARGVGGAAAREIRIFVTGGIAEANPESCTILAERVEDISKLNTLDAIERLNRAKTTLQNSFDETAKQDAEIELRIAEAILEALH